MEKENNGTVKAAGFMMVITLVGKILGLVREMFLAGKFSVGMEASAFLTASQIPRIFFDVVFASAISASFIPIFNEYLKKYGKKAAFELSSNFITIMTFLTGIITIFGIIFAPYITNVFADGFDRQTAELCVKLLRILFPTTIFTGIAFSLVGILQSMDEFNIPAAMSIASNVVIILYFIFLNDVFGVYGLTVAFLIGWLMQAVIQFPALLKKGYRYSFCFKIKDDGIKKIFALMLPVMVGTWVQPINIAINTKFASRLFNGAGVSAINYANTIYSIIIGVFVLSIANVIFPKLSRMSISNDNENFGNTISSTMEAMAFLIFPMALGLMVLSENLISVVYQRGNFDDFAVTITSRALFYFSLGMPGFAIQNILSRAFYAEQNGKTPLISGIVSIVVNVILCEALYGKIDVGGLAIASAVSQTISAVILFVPMQIKNKILNKKNIKEILKMLIAALFMLVFIVIIKNVVLSLGMSKNIEGIAVICFTTLSGIVVYALCAMALKINMMTNALNIIASLKRR